MSIDVVIPNYNGSDLIRKNFPELLASVSKYNVGKIIISDDCSRADDFKKLADFIAEIKSKSKIPIELIENIRNVGFSSNVNVGVSHAESDLILLLNTDVTTKKDFLDAALVDLDKNENLFGVGLMDESMENGKTIFRGRGLASWQRGFLVHARGEVDRNDTFWISGGSCIFKRAIYNKLGGLDQNYNPFYWEDIDLSYRARKSGYEIMFEPKSVVTHNHAEGSIKRHYKSSEVKKIAYRNQIIFVWKNVTEFKYMLSHIFWLPYHLIRSFARRDGAFILGLGAAIAKIPGIIDKRLRQKKLYKKTDGEILT